MIFTTRESLEDSIIRQLSQGKTDASTLFGHITEQNKKISIQAMYKALRYLIKAAVVVKSGKQLTINQEWIDTLSEAFNTQTLDFPQLANGETVTYKYNNLSNLDAYWKHLMKAFDTKLGDFPVFLYSPYHIWYHISERALSETEYFTSFEKRKHYGFFVMGNTTPIDGAFKKKFQSDFLQIDAWEKSPLKENDYLTIIDDYIVHTILDTKTTKAIAHYYNSGLSHEKAIEDLAKVLTGNNTSKIKIERNAKKAKQLRKKLFKNFYLPKEIKDKYDLF